MGYIREIYQAGKTIIIKERVKRKVEGNKKRAPKIQPTSEKVWQYNLKMSIFKLTLILNHNFAPGDHHLQCTYKNSPKDREAAKKDRKAFLRKVSEKCKRQGIKFKWVAVTEKKGGKYHHHIVCSNIPVKIIKECWGERGIMFHNPLWDYPNYANLAEYLLKEAAALHMEEGVISKKRFTTSRNIVVPEPEIVEITRKNIEDEPKPFKYYQIDEDSVQTYENELTGTTCREYIMVSLKDDVKKRHRSKTVMSTGEYINFTKALREAYHEQQETFFEKIKEWSV